MRSSFVRPGSIVLLLLVLASVPARARADDEFNRRGAFVGGGVSYGLSAFQGTAGRQDFGDSLGYNLHAGYRLYDFLAVEAVHEYFDDFGADLGADGDVHVRTFTGTANVKLLLPLDRFQPYLTGGIGFLFAERSGSAKRLGIDSSDHGAAFIGRVAGGFDIFVHRNFSIYGEVAYTMPTGGLSDLYDVSVGSGLKYNFNF